MRHTLTQLASNSCILHQKAHNVGTVSERREAVIEVAAQIAESRSRVQTLTTDLDKEKIRLAQLEDDLDKLLRVGSTRQPSIAEKVLEYIEANQGGQFSSEEIAAALKAKEHSVRSALVRLTDDGKIQRAGRGKYTGNNSVPDVQEQVPINDDDIPF
jgi:hypothetical protein